MIEFLQSFWEYILKIGENHNVDPRLFAILYVLSIPPYLGSMAWVVRNYRKKKSISLPFASTLFFFIMPSLYVLFFGRNVAWWVYVIVVVLVLQGAYTVRKKVKTKTKNL